SSAFHIAPDVSPCQPLLCTRSHDLVRQNPRAPASIPFLFLHAKILARGFLRSLPRSLGGALRLHRAPFAITLSSRLSSLLANERTTLEESSSCTPLPTLVVGRCHVWSRWVRPYCILP